jgi:hypothetical protein
MAYTTPIATKIFNYKNVLLDLNIADFKFKPPDCFNKLTLFIHSERVYLRPHSHVLPII